MAAIRLLSSTALKTSLDVLAPQFERATACTLDIAYAPSAQLTERVADGEAADAAILTSQGVDELIRRRKATAGGRIDLCRSEIVVAVAKGARKPDISSAEKFKQAMLKATSIAISHPSSGGTTGSHLAKVFEQMGIAEVLKPKIVYSQGGPQGLIGGYIVRGEAEIGIQQDAELMAIQGIDIVGPLPAEIQSVSLFSYATLATSANGGAHALGKFLRSPAAIKVMKDNGLKPVAETTTFAGS